ncbi:DRMBL-domain-containing protein [Clavulina sp. PMI_390]|nr:DRMBL-domain-containing protein [Clavulina sp. PMI_390]
MSSYKDKMAWKQAELDHARAGTKLNAERLAQQKQRKGESDGGAGRRLAPFYKIMQGMPVAVDAFRYGKIPGVEAYLLTHFHSDHYTNLSSNWKNGPIYCSSTTASLVKLILKVDEKWVYTLPMDEPTIIPGTEVTVTLIEANHCPGSVLFLLEGRQTVSAGDSKSSYRSPHIGTNRIFRYLHCGDFRASPQHILHPSIKGKKIDICYLDTTYLNPKYSFPPQRQVIDACAALAKQHVLGAPKNTLQDALVKSEPGSNEASALVKEEDPEDSWLNPDAEELDDPTGGGDDIAPSVEIPLVKDEECTKDVKPSDRILVVVGTYSIGKERIVKGVAHALSSKIFVEARKQSILACQDDPELHSMLTRDPYDAQVHLVPLGSVNSDKIGDYLAQFKGHFSRVLAFRPTGWTYSPPAGSEQNINMSSGALNSLIGKQQRRTFLSTSLTPMRNSTWKHMLYGVPYSEHSSFIELSCFAMSLQCTKIIATVNVGRETGRARMNRWFETWERERKKRAERGDPAVVTFRSAEYW